MTYLSVVILSCLALVNALHVSNIMDCPPLIHRPVPTDVTDLRIDDFKVVAGLGDSIMAGFAMMGINYADGGIRNMSFISEYRGSSFAVGGDRNAITLPNFMRRYGRTIHGPSIDDHLVAPCRGDNCDSPVSLYHPIKDNLNAAKTSAMAFNLRREMNYLIPRMKSYFLRFSYKNDWKLITLQIGSNDQCAACLPEYAALASPEAYGQYIEETLIRIRNEIPRTVVHLVSNFRVAHLFPLTDNQPYCVQNGILSGRISCSCSNTAEGMATMEAHALAYDEQLRLLAEKYRASPGDTFGVIYKPMHVDISSFPVDALSNIDCFHPSLKGHEWLAKVVWNQMLLPRQPETVVWDYNSDEQLYCPEETDRLDVTS